MKIVHKKIVASLSMLIILIGIITLAVYLKSVMDYKRAVNDISIDEICLADIPDGVYIGECNVNFIYAKVEVTVHNGEITDIHILEHKNERGQAAEPIVEQIVLEQKIDVDAISGATNSSTVLKKAVENALKTSIQ